MTTEIHSFARDVNTIGKQNTDSNEGQLKKKKKQSKEFYMGVTLFALAASFLSVECCLF